MTDHGFDRSKGAARKTVRAIEHFAQGFHFRPVSQGDAGAVSFDQSDSFRIDPALCVRAFDCEHLSFDTRGQKSLCASIARNSSGLQNGKNPVAVRLRITPALQHEKSCPFRQDRPIGAFVERPRATSRQSLKLAKKHLNLRRH